MIAAFFGAIPGKVYAWIAGLVLVIVLACGLFGWGWHVRDQQAEREAAAQAAANGLAVAKVKTDSLVEAAADNKKVTAQLGRQTAAATARASELETSLAAQQATPYCPENPHAPTPLLGQSVLDPADVRLLNDARRNAVPDVRPDATVRSDAALAAPSAP